MKKYETETIRNLGMFSHGGEGKTTIVEAMLFLAGENTRLGRVDEGTSLMDYEPEEIERKASISASACLLRLEQVQDQPRSTPPATITSSTTPSSA